ncbi:energy transducer TonB [Roseisolibacter sp. H3M3-2]|uniref:energy transducer TonB n=1 Tax=Roseisolibacter sp. H3M3-2 TaxID=3031323 RepID=UPI0023DC29EE|nr:energy transducer TonB [Roseisolibacter sp. H3M3-2]MDF1504905.1 energy transducer TonB [Roseisolibacter sp. H3M3-2]
MGLHLIESGRHQHWLAAPTFWSAAAHAGLVASLIASAPAGTGEEGTVGTTREVVFFLPLLPKAPPQEAPVELRWTGDGKGTGDGAPSLPEGPTGFVERTREGGGRAVPVPVAEEGPPIDGDPVFVASELDVEVQRDPSSVGPRYPEPLRLTNTEGAVTAEWIVDTTGAADPASFKIVASSHPLFTDAVKECLTGMKFRPAELGGQRVRQLVRQEFRFQLQLPVAAADTVARPSRKKKG